MKTSTPTFEENKEKAKRYAIDTFFQFLKKNKSLQEFEDALGKSFSSLFDHEKRNTNRNIDITDLYLHLEDGAFIFHKKNTKWSKLDKEWKKIVEDAFSSGASLYSKRGVSYLFGYPISMVSSFVDEDCFIGLKPDSTPIPLACYPEDPAENGVVFISPYSIEELLSSRLLSENLVLVTWRDTKDRYFVEIRAEDNNQLFLLSFDNASSISKHEIVFSVVDALFDKQLISF